ncbi:MAG: hypothetical protein JSV86_06260, partial [Gemmatimonadota bacterium]
PELRPVPVPELRPVPVPELELELELELRPERYKGSRRLVSYYPSFFDPFCALSALRVVT